MGNGSLRFKDNSGNVISFISGSGTDIVISGGTLNLLGMTEVALGNVTISGSTLVNGTQGNQGPQGINGFQGPIGLQGTTGAQGNQGPTGFQGFQGNQGPTGVQGTTGSQGNQGPQGNTGVSAGITGYTNSGDNRILTSTSATEINAEANLTFDGSTLGVTGAATFSSSVTAASFIPTSSTISTNGMYLHATNTLGFSTNSALKLLINSHGSLSTNVSSIMTTPWKSFEIGTGVGTMVLAGRTDGVNNLILGTNWYYDGGAAQEFIGSGYSSQYLQDNGDHIIRSSSISGSAGANITFNEIARFKNDGNVGIGTSSPSYRLHVVAASAIVSTNILRLDSGATGFSNVNDANTAFSIMFDGCAYKASTGVIQKNGAEIQMLKSGSWNEDAGGSGTRASLIFKTNNGTIDSPDLSERMRITSGGNVLIGTTSDISSTRRELVMRGSNGSVVSLGNNTTADRFQIVSDSGENALLNNKANTPMILYTNNTERMRITSGGNVGIGTTSPQSKLDVNGITNSTNYRTIYSSVTIPASSTTTLLTLSSSVAGLYIINANFGNQGNAIYGSALIVVANGGSFRIITNGSGSSATLTLSGANVQITNGLGIPIDASASAILIAN